MINNIDAKEGKRLVDAITRNSLYAFARKAFEEVDASQDFIDNWHIELICSELEKCLRGETKRLIITMPPRNLKTHLVSIAFPAFILGHRPEARILNVSYSQDLAYMSSKSCSKLMDSDFYRSIFKTRLSSEKNAEEKFDTTENGYRYATSISGTLTGLGGNFIIIDDPIKSADATSESARKQVIDWYKNTLISRLNNKEKGVIILVMQRLHVDDLAGYLIKNNIDNEWKILNLPAIATEDENYIVNNRIIGRKKGQALCPGLESLARLEKIRTEMGEYNFNAQYLQNPVPEKGNIIVFEQFQRYDHILNNELSIKIQSWDIAVSTKDSSDYSVCITATMINDICYIEDICREKLSPAVLQEKIVSMRKLHKPDLLFIEDATPSKVLIDNLKQMAIPIIPINPAGNKAQRALSMVFNIQAGKILLPSTANWLNDFKLECQVFPNGSHDDQIDALSQLVINAPKHTKERRIINSMRNVYKVNDNPNTIHGIFDKLSGEPTIEELNKLTHEERQIYELYRNPRYFDGPSFDGL